MDLPRHQLGDPALLSTTSLLDELTTTCEELQVAEEEIRVQNDELLRTREALIEEAARYRELFEHAPVPYVVTDRYGAITDAMAVASLLKLRVLAAEDALPEDLAAILRL